MKTTVNQDYHVIFEVVVSLDSDAAPEQIMDEAISLIQQGHGGFEYEEIG